MSGRRLPVAPRPYRDELLSSWLGRIACRYGLDAAGLSGALTDDDDGAPGSLIDDIAPARKDIVSLARACGVDPGRLARLALVRRRPERPRTWFASQGPPWALTVARSPPVCRACFETDRGGGRDEYLRSEWLLAERCVCPAHRLLLVDCCPHCRARLHVGFRLRGGRAQAICRECEQELSTRPAREEDGALREALISLQDRIGAIVRSSAPGRRRRLEEAVSRLWAPLDDPGAARPTLALWIEESGWRCPSDAQQAIGAPLPLGRLPITWRGVTLIALDALFGIERDERLAPSVAATNLLRRAALPRGRDGRRRQVPVPPPRPFAEYLHLAHEILSAPEWATAVHAPRRQQDRILSRLITAKLVASPPPGLGKGQSANEARD